MNNDRPHPWLGCPAPPKFYYSDCGHLVGCSDPTVDLDAIRARKRKRVFEEDMTRAIETGEAGHRSSSPLSGHLQEAICLVALDPCPQNIWHAQWLFEANEDWYRGIEEEGRRKRALTRDEQAAH